MTKEDYTHRVEVVASTLLYELGVEKWKKENPDLPFHRFWDEVDGYDMLHSVVDSEFSGMDWKGATEILQVSDQDPDHVDSGLYEGCGWKKILICIAFEVFSWDVQAEVEQMFDTNEAPTKVMQYPTNDRQIGFYPATKVYRLKDWGASNRPDWLAVAHDFVKIIFRQSPMNAVVFEGEVSFKPQTSCRVKCRRIYLQGFEDRKIQDILPECEHRFGVRCVNK